MRHCIDLLSRWIRFIVIHHDCSAFYDTIPQLLASGEIKTPLEHIVKGLDNVSLSLLYCFLATARLRFPFGNSSLLGRGFPRFDARKKFRKECHLPRVKFPVDFDFQKCQYRAL